METTAQKFRRSIRSAAAIRVLLVAALTSTAAIGSYSYVEHNSEPTVGERTNLNPISSAAPHTSSFTTAEVGNCATWDVDNNGQATKFEKVSCDQKHRFEVSTREDLGTYPSSEFGPNAPLPSLTRQAQLREELCQAPTLQYLNGVFDPLGKYTIAPILPPAEYWEAGDRTMLCGIQSTDKQGIPQLTIGPVSANDQARVFSTGACIAVDSSAEFREVACTEDHQLETVSTQSLKNNFPSGPPSKDAQNEFLSKTCTQAAIDYLGGEENMYQSTLQTFWPTVTEKSWLGGSYSVNCFLMSPGEGRAKTFKTLRGSAKEKFTIDGKEPPPQPERKPLRPERLQKP